MTAGELNLLSRKVLDGAFAVHNELGPGLLEKTYVACLQYELEKRGMHVELEVPVAVVYDNVKMTDVGYRLDMLVDGELVLEAKSIDGVTPMHRAQLLTYLKHSRRRLGLLINFKEPHLKDGILRMVNGL